MLRRVVGYRIIIITAEARAEAIAKTLNADGHFGKPMDFDKLSDCLKMLPEPAPRAHSSIRVMLPVRRLGETGTANRST